MTSLKSVVSRENQLLSLLHVGPETHILMTPLCFMYSEEGQILSVSMTLNVGSLNALGHMQRSKENLRQKYTKLGFLHESQSPDLGFHHLTPSLLDHANLSLSRSAVNTWQSFPIPALLHH